MEQPVSKDLVLLRLDQLRGKFNVLVDQFDQARKDVLQTENNTGNSNETYQMILDALAIIEKQCENL